MLLSRRIELPNMVTVQCSHDANPCEHGRPAEIVDSGLSEIVSSTLCATGLAAETALARQ
jgi:hypothetical protein